MTFRYPLSDGTGHVEVATTRVETMLGDTGIAVHPDDARYRDLVGKTVRHPFDGRELPIVADGAVDPAFGTGAVKVTPAHDPTDFEIAQRAGLPLLNILDAEARINENAAEEFYGLGRYDARQAVREELEKLDLFVGVEHPYRALRRPLLPLPQRDRAVDVGAPVVRRGGRAEGPGDRGGRWTGGSRSGPSAGGRRT